MGSPRRRKQAASAGGAAGPPRQVWTRTIEGREHRVEVRGSLSRHIRWTVDGVEAAAVRRSDGRARIDGHEHGRLLVVHSALGTPQRATVLPPGPDAKAAAGLGGTDLVPAPGSRAAAYERKVLEHPTRYSVLQTVAAAAAVVVPVVAIWLLVQLARLVPWPHVDLPDVPWPDLPSIPWPDLPSIPWPDVELPDVSLPAWLVWVLDRSEYVVPVVVAFVVARMEVRRRRRHAEERAQLEGTPGGSKESARPTDEPSDQPSEEAPRQDRRAPDEPDGGG